MKDSDVKIVTHPGPIPYGPQQYYQLYKDDELDVRLYTTEPNKGICMWIGDDKPTYRGFGKNPDCFREYVRGINKALEVLEQVLKEEGKVVE